MSIPAILNPISNHVQCRAARVGQVQRNPSQSSDRPLTPPTSSPLPFPGTIASAYRPEVFGFMEFPDFASTPAQPLQLSQEQILRNYVEFMENAQRKADKKATNTATASSLSAGNGQTDTTDDLDEELEKAFLADSDDEGCGSDVDDEADTDIDDDEDVKVDGDADTNEAD